MVPDSYFKAPTVSKLRRFGIACILAPPTPLFQSETELGGAAKTALK